VYELGGEGFFAPRDWNQQRIKTSVFLVRRIEFVEGQELAIRMMSLTGILLPLQRILFGQLKGDLF
jgi:hypothetical protein